MQPELLLGSQHGLLERMLRCDGRALSQFNVQLLSDAVLFNFLLSDSVLPYDHYVHMTLHFVLLYYFVLDYSNSISAVFDN